MLLSFSRLDPFTKRIGLIVETAWLMPEQRFLIAGNELPGSRLRLYAKGCPKNLEFLVCDTFDKRDLYNRCEVFLAPYLNEDFGITPIEAMSFGKPVVTCRDSGGVMETVIHLETGYAANPNPQGLLEGIKFCLQNKEKMRARCIERAKQFRWETFREAFRSKFLDFFSHY